METKGPSMIINIFRSVQTLRWGEGGGGHRCSKLRQAHSLLSPWLDCNFPYHLCKFEELLGKSLEGICNVAKSQLNFPITSSQLPVLFYSV
jgi:hypothetical protein